LLDERYLSIRSRLCRLPSSALQKFLSYDRPVVYDDLNYRASDDAYCPISVMIGVEDILKDKGIKPSQNSVLEELTKHEVFGTIKGVSGEFYRQDRRSDIRWLCQQILMERSFVSKT
jgi:hypothetical protein